MFDRLWEILGEFGEPELTPHYEIHFGLRNPSVGRGLGRNGVRDRKLIEAYAEALERTYSFLTELGWKPPPDEMTRSGRTPVYVCEVADVTDYVTPITFIDMHGIPSMALPCRYDELTAADELIIAGMVASHEATHVFNNTCCRIDSDNADIWLWLDDAIAGYVERALFPKAPQHLRRVIDWVDEPDAPLDAEWARYERALFVEYLCGKSVDKAKFLAKVWAESGSDRTPCQVIADLLAQENQEFASAGSDDLFGSGYCVDSYFIWKMAPEVYERYGERAIAETVDLISGQKVRIEASDLWTVCPAAITVFALSAGSRNCPLCWRPRTRRPLPTT